MIRAFPRRRAQHYITAGNDKVLFGVSLPSECRLNGLTAQVHITSNQINAIGKASMYAIEGYILPVLDPDSAPDFDTLWDTLVPKDNDTDTIDMDTGAADTQPFFEPGEMALEELMDVGLQPERIYNRQKMLSFANSALRQEDASALEWAAAEVVNIRIRKNYYVKQPSVVVFGFANPSLDDVTSTLDAALAENEWPRVKYIELVLEQALMKHMGLVEAGAETPWEEAAALLRKYIEPDMFQQTASAWLAQGFHVVCNATFDVSLVGTLGKLQLGSGG